LHHEDSLNPQVVFARGKARHRLLFTVAAMVAGPVVASRSRRDVGHRARRPSFRAWPFQPGVKREKEGAPHRRHARTFLSLTAVSLAFGSPAGSPVLRTVPAFAGLSSCHRHDEFASRTGCSPSARARHAARRPVGLAACVTLATLAFAPGHCQRTWEARRWVGASISKCGAFPAPRRRLSSSRSGTGQSP
jgi:hypothetical protein